MAPPDSPGISDDAVLLKTGKTWEEWFALLDTASARDRKHKDNAVWLASEHGVNAWWCQMITTAYERARGLRDKYQRPDGRFQGSVSKTFEVGDDVLYRFWVNDGERARWLNEPVEITASTPPKSIRLTMATDGTKVDAYLLSVGDGRARLTINHGKLPDSAAVDQRKAFWKERLEVLRRLVEPSAAL